MCSRDRKKPAQEGPAFGGRAFVQAMVDEEFLERESSLELNQSRRSITAEE